MRDVVVVDALRTPIGKHGGALRSVRPDDLAAHVIRALISRTGSIRLPSTTSTGVRRIRPVKTTGM